MKQIKCGKCDKTYSPLKIKCPYCGAMRGSRGKYARDSDNERGRVIIGVVLICVLLVAIVVLLVSTGGDDGELPDNPGAVTSQTPLPDDEDLNTSVPGTEVSPSPSPTATPTPPPSVTSVEIRFYGSISTDFTEPVNSKVPLTVKVLPEGIEGVEITWTSSNTSVFDVVPSLDGKSADVTITGKGTAILTVECNGITAKCTVRGR